MKRNKLIFLIGVFASVVAWADDVDFLDKQINELSARRDELLAELSTCEKNTRGYKIAGVATLAATAGGVVGNIALHKKIQEGASGGGGGGSNVKTDTQSQAERDESSCNEFLKLGIPLPPECNG